MVALKTNFGGQEMMSTWVLREDMNIHKKGKIMGITMSRINMKKNN
jgi:hypothetical protein